MDSKTNITINYKLKEKFHHFFNTRSKKITAIVNQTCRIRKINVPNFIHHSIVKLSI